MNKIFHLFLSLMIVATSALSLFAQTSEIFIDESFEDWDSIQSIFIDGADVSSGLDLMEFQVTNDDENLYIRFSLNSDMDMTDNLIPQNLWFIIDADNNASTGFFQQPGYGSELAINFKDHYAWFNPPGNSTQVNFKDLEFYSAPTVTSSEFEFAIGRNIRPNGIDPLFTGDTIRLLFQERFNGDSMPNHGTVFQYVFDNSNINTYQPIILDKKDTSHIRLASYNVLKNGGWTGANGIQNLESVVKAINADIFVFQECRDATIPEVESFLNSWLPLSNSNGWYLAKSSGLITASKWPIFNQWNLWRKMATLITLPSSYPKDLLIVNGHLSCCGADANRQEQADEFISFILDAKSPGGTIDLDTNTPFVFAGDMNLVGYKDQLETIITGDIQNTSSYGIGGSPDWDGTEIMDAKALHADRNMTFTWRSLSGGSYPPGRLDFHFYSDAVLNQEKGFILDTEAMDSTRWAIYSLDSIDTYAASDHLPIVVDYSFKNLTSLNIESDIQLKVFPNPVSNQLYITGNWHSSPKVELINTVGSIMDISYSESNDGLILKTHDLHSGVYILRLIIGEQVFTKRIIIEK